MTSSDTPNSPGTAELRVCRNCFKPTAQSHFIDAERLGVAWSCTTAPCPNEPHESGMAYDAEADDAVCPLCGKHESTEMGSL